MPDLSYEIKHYQKKLRSIGADEVGRGCLAGPVVAGVVLLPEKLISDPALVTTPPWESIDDSKKLTPKKRAELAKFIGDQALVAVAWVMPDEIDRFNILQASMLAMRKAVRSVLKKTDEKQNEKIVVLVDGNQNPFDKYFLMPEMPEIKDEVFTAIKVQTIIKGDSHSLSIAAASIVAKVFRDNWMEEYDRQFPGYGFAKHKGYLTKDHLEAIAKLGPCAIHRMSFKPLYKENCLNFRRPSTLN